MVKIHVSEPFNRKDLTGAADIRPLIDDHRSITDSLMRQTATRGDTTTLVIKSIPFIPMLP